MLIIRCPMNCQCEAWKAEVDHGVPCRESFDAQHELNRHLLSDIDVALHILRVQLFLENATMDDAEIFASVPNGHQLHPGHRGHTCKA